MNEKKMIFPDDPEAAVPVTVTAYKSLDGSIWLDETVARYTSSTHRRCGVDGHEPFGRNSYCQQCEEFRQKGKYGSFPRQPHDWDGGTGCFQSYLTDEYFYSLEEVIEHCVMEGVHPDSLRLVHSENIYATVEEDPDEQFTDFIADDRECPDDVAGAWEELVSALKECKPICYRSIDVAVELPPDFMDRYQEAWAEHEGDEE